MEYLERVLGIHAVPRPGPAAPIPNYICARYRIQPFSLDGTAAVFVYPTDELAPIDAVKKHLSRIERAEKAPAVLVPDRLTYRQKEYLLRDHIPCIVDGKQIYLPFMAVYLQERGDGEKPEITKLLPSAQILFLYFIYNGCGELLTGEAAKKLGFTAMSVSRASRQLEEMGLIETRKRGVQKVIISEKGPEELFLSAKHRLLDPVKRTLFVPRALITEELPLSGYSALSEYSMISPPTVECRAAGSAAAWEKASSSRLQSTPDQCKVQLWRYDPGKLAAGGRVDRLSLALSLRDDKDERAEEAVEEMLAGLWREIHGKRT